MVGKLQSFYLNISSRLNPQKERFGIIFAFEQHKGSQKRKVIPHTHTVKDSSAITQMDLERHFSMFALCLRPSEDLVSLKTNRPLI